MYPNKRLFDILISLLGIIFAALPMLLIYMLIYIFNGRPAVFKQKRVGENGQDFWIYKFRTMSNDSQAHLGVFEAGSQQRVTRFGKFLRKTKLDELPQLFNVLNSTMSIVGPRPEVRKWVDVYPERWRQVLKNKPGITDPAAIFYRDEEEVLASSDTPDLTYKDLILPRKLDMYEEYISQQSLVKDVLIILETVKVVARV